MTRALYALLLGLVGTGIIHIAALLLTPRLSGEPEWAGKLYETRQLSGAERRGMVGSEDDPSFQIAACRFDLTAGSARLTAPQTPLFWSLSVYDGAGTNMFSYNERASKAGLDLRVVDRGRVVPPSPTIVVSEIDATQGIVLIRVFAPDESVRSAANAFLGSINCAQEPL